MERNNITSKRMLDFYIKADNMMASGSWKPSLMTKIKDFFFPNYKWRYLVSMRKACYYSNFPIMSLGG